MLIKMGVHCRLYAVQIVRVHAGIGNIHIHRAGGGGFPDDCKPGLRITDFASNHITIPNTYPAPVQGEGPDVRQIICWLYVIQNGKLSVQSVFQRD
ncbi:MAG: hypothetical protein POH28_01700 [Acidocella sp.]|nr:hypothetical protein [Acidocella sp.]